MNRNELNDILMELRLMEDFLADCDNGLADEIGLQNQISGRIVKIKKEFAETRREVEAAARELAL